jgi:hypothetical protein
MERLLELGALIEQKSIETPIHLEIALMALENIRELFKADKNQDEPRPGPTMLPVPQIWVPSEPIPDNDLMGMFGGNATTEALCFEPGSLGPEELAMVNSIPFLWHEELM